MNKLRAFFKDYLEELLYKVQWPSFEDLQSSTITVLIASMIIALIIFVMDSASNLLLTEGLYQFFIH